MLAESIRPMGAQAVCGYHDRKPATFGAFSTKNR